MATTFQRAAARNLLRTAVTRAVASGAACLSLALPASAAEPAEVIHWWTSSGETAAVGKFKEVFTAKGFEWKDLAVGGGDNQRLLLKTRVGKGNPPDAAQVNSDVRAYAADRANLANLDALAAKEGWDKVLPAPVLNYAKMGGPSYVAVPVNAHQQNVMWINAAVLKKIGADAPPKTWEEFFAMADKAKAAGVVPLAMAEDRWINAFFQQIAYSTMPTEAYRKAFYEADEAAIKSPGMLRAFEVLRKTRAYVDRGASNRKWNEATQMVIQGRAFAQVMGDWAKGEFIQAGKKPNADYLCAALPGPAGAYLFNSDAFMFFKRSKDSAAQMALAQTFMDREAQQAFSLLKGSVPVRTDADVSQFDECGKKSYADFLAAGKSGTLSAAPQMVQTPAKFAAWLDVTVSFWYDEGMSPQQGAEKMVAAAKAN